jgi:hypothetical protein
MESPHAIRRATQSRALRRPTAVRRAGRVGRRRARARRDDQRHPRAAIAGTGSTCTYAQAVDSLDTRERSSDGCALASGAFGTNDTVDLNLQTGTIAASAGRSCRRSR